MYRAKYKQERQEVSMLRESYNEALQSVKNGAETVFSLIEDNWPFR